MNKGATQMAYYARQGENEKIGDVRFQPDPRVLVRQTDSQGGYRIYETRSATDAEVAEWLAKTPRRSVSAAMVRGVDEF
jgi:hypothetical protein